MHSLCDDLTLGNEGVPMSMQPRNPAWRWAIGLLLSVPGAAIAEEPSEADVRRAIERGLTIVQKAAQNYPEHRQCYSCHHQTLPLLAMVHARRAGIAVDEPLLDAQLEFLKESFSDRHDRIREGNGVGGQAMTAGYALWTYEIAEAPRDDLSQAFVAFLLKKQHDDGHWGPPSNRPPMEESKVSCTVLAAYGLQRFAAGSQEDEVHAALARAVDWLKTAPLESQEDRMARLWGCVLLEADEDFRDSALKIVLDAQRDDGGWAQIAGMESDAYATATTLFVLQDSGLKAEHAALREGLRYLLSTQHEDGSWFVQTRAKPVQIYFDNGDPHGKSQFLSVAATGWATAVLARALPQIKP